MGYICPFIILKIIVMILHLTNRWKKRILFSCCIIGFTLSLQAQVYWDGGAGTSNWNDANNWNTDAVPVPGDSVILDHSTITGNYHVVLPNAQVSVKSLNIAPSSVGDSIILDIPVTNITNNNLRLTGTGFHALRIGDRGRIDNRHPGGANTDAIVIDDVNNFGMLLDTGAYYYHGSNTKDIGILLNLVANLNSTFEYDMPTSNSLMVFPLVANIDSLVFYHLKLSGNNGVLPSTGTYAVTLAKNWDLIINGDFTVDNAAFGLIRGDANQASRSVHFRGNVTAVNTTKTTWVDLVHGTPGPVTLGWNTVFNGTGQPQVVTGNINFLDRMEVNSPGGIQLHGIFNIGELSFGMFPNNPGLTLTQGVVTTLGNGMVDITLADTSRLSGYAPAGSLTSASYINGKLQRNITGSGTYDFPVGSPGNYQLLSLIPAALIGTTKLEVSFHTSPLGTISNPLTESGEYYHSITDGGYWKMTPNSPLAGGSYDLHVYQTGFTNAAGAVALVSRIDSADAWGLQANPAGGNLASGIIDVYRTGYTDFFEMGIASTLDELTDLAISYDNYLPGIPTPADTLYLDFTVVNNGPTDLLAGDTLYFSARINGTYMGLNLLGTETPIVLSANLDAGATFAYNPGYLVPAQLLPFFPGATTLEICAVVWGKGLVSVDIVTPSFPADSDSSNNTTCVIYDPSPLLSSSQENQTTPLVTHVYPVPTRDVVTFGFSQPGEYRVALLNTLGQVVQTIQVVNLLQEQVDISSFDNGVYFYRIYDGNSYIVSQGKLVKQ